MSSYRTFKIPLKNKSELSPKYSYDDIGLNSDDICFFGYVDWYGKQLPPKGTIDPIESWADEISYRHYFTKEIVDEETVSEYSVRGEITVHNIPQDIALKMLSLPGVEEIDTTLYHLSHILKSALSNGSPIDDILRGIKDV